MAEGSRSKSLEQTPKDDNAGGGRIGRWLIGWVLVPALVIGGLFAAGVHVGARHPDMLLARAVLWLTGAEAERPPQPASEPAEAEAERPPQVASAPAEAEVERPPPAPSGPPELLQLDFGWPVPAQAIVEQQIESPGNNAKLRYRIEVERQGTELLVHHRDPRVLELHDRPIEGGSKEAELEGRLLLAGFIPSIAVSPDAELIRVIDLEAYVERTREALAASPEGHEAIALIMNSPQMLWTLEQRIGDIWRGWAGYWVGIEIMSDQELRFESHEGVGMYRVVGLDAQTVSLEFRVEHELSKSELRSMFAAIASKAGSDLSTLDAELEGVTGGKDMVATATLRRDTLLPLRSSNQLDMWIETPGKPRKTRREVTRYTFEWQ